MKYSNSNNCYSCSKSATEILEITEDNPNENEALALVFSCEFCEILRNIFFTEHIRASASDIRMQVVVIYNLNLSLQFVTINFTLLCKFSRWPMLQCRLNFYIRLFFGRVMFSHDSKTASKEKIITKYKIQKTLIHIFHNRLLGDQNSAGADIVMRPKVTLTKNFGMKTSTK